jgi:hypothetical protein
MDAVQNVSFMYALVGLQAQDVSSLKFAFGNNISKGPKTYIYRVSQ